MNRHAKLEVRYSRPLNKAGTEADIKRGYHQLQFDISNCHVQPENMWNVDETLVVDRFRKRSSGKVIVAAGRGRHLRHMFCKRLPSQSIFE